MASIFSNPIAAFLEFGAKIAQRLPTQPPGNQVVNELLSKAQGALQAFLGLEGKLSTIQTQILNGVRLAEQKNQGELVQRLNTKHAETVILMDRFQSEKGQLLKLVYDATQLKFSVDSGSISKVAGAARSVELYFMYSPILREAAELMIRIPKAILEAQALIGNTNAAPKINDPVAPPSAPFQNFLTSGFFGFGSGAAVNAQSAATAVTSALKWGVGLTALALLGPTVLDSFKKGKRRV